MVVTSLRQKEFIQLIRLTHSVSLHALRTSHAPIVIKTAPMIKPGFIVSLKNSPIIKDDPIGIKYANEAIRITGPFLALISYKENAIPTGPTPPSPQENIR